MTKVTNQIHLLQDIDWDLFDYLVIAIMSHRRFKHALDF